MSTVCLLVAAGTKHTVLTVGPSQGNEKKVALELGPGLPRLTLTQPQTRLVPHLLQVQEAFLEYIIHCSFISFFGHVHVTCRYGRDPAEK